MHEPSVVEPLRCDSGSSRNTDSARHGGRAINVTKHLIATSDCKSYCKDHNEYLYEVKSLTGSLVGG